MEKESDVKLITLYCWNCGKKFYGKFDNVIAGQIFCSDKCRIENFKKEIELAKINKRIK